MTFGVVSTALEFLQVALCWVIGWRLFSDRRWRTVRWTIVGVLVMAPGLVILRMLAVGEFFGADRPTLFGMFGGEFGTVRISVCGRA
jgi:hypothetical protein